MEVDNTEFEVYLETPQENFPIQEIYTALTPMNREQMTASYTWNWSSLTSNCLKSRNLQIFLEESREYTPNRQRKTPKDINM